MPQHKRPVFSRFYGFIAPHMDNGGLGEHRRRLVDGLSGDVVDVGAGSGLNFLHYPPEVSRVVAVEPAPYLSRLAAGRASQTLLPAYVVEGVAERLPFEDGSFDAAVFSLVLCSVRDQQAALAEILRVLRPGGELRFLEHVRADACALRIVQHVVDRTLWPLLVGGCHTSRDTTSAISKAGFEIGTLERFRFPEFSPIPSSPHIRGSATRRGLGHPAAVAGEG